LAELIRLDRTGHTVLAQWRPEDAASVALAQAALQAELAQGLLAIATDDAGRAEQVRELPPGAPRVILRCPIAGG
jgi:hypothetical protein